MEKQQISEKIRSRIESEGKGYVFTPKDFLDIASHETVRQTLKRFTERSWIRRLLRGVYDYPAFSSFLNAVVSPDPDAIARAIARSNGWTIVPNGETALNLLGLSMQVPAHWIYFTDGPNKSYKWWGGTLKFKHRTGKESSKLSRKTAIVVQSLKALGEEKVDSWIVKQISSKLTWQEKEMALQEAKYVSSWVYEIIRQIAVKNESSL